MNFSLDITDPYKLDAITYVRSKYNLERAKEDQIVDDPTYLAFIVNSLLENYVQQKTNEGIQAASEAFRSNDLEGLQAAQDAIKAKISEIQSKQ